MQPIDYTRGFQPVNIADNIAGGFDVGSGIRAELQRRRDDMIARQQAEQKQIAAMKRAAEYERDLFGVFNDPSPQNLARLQLQYPERIKEFKSGFDTLDKARVADEKRFIGEVYAASRSNPEVAKKLLSDRVAALENAREDATEEKTALDMLDSNPKQALGYIGSLAAFTLDKDQIEALTKLSGEERAEALAPATQAKAEADAATAEIEAAAAPAKTAAELRKIDSEIRNVSSMVADRAARLNLDRDRLNLDIQAKLSEFANKPISASAEKIVNDGVAASLASSLSADKFDELAGKLEKIRAAGGAAGGFSEYAAQVFGSKDEVSALRQEYTRLRSQLAISSLPPGPATDKDIEIAFKGFPKETDSPAYVAQFLRGTAKLQRIDSTVQEAKAQWAQQNGNLGNAKNGGEINGIPYKAGETLKDFTKRAIDSTNNAVPAQPISGGFRIVRVRPQ